MKPREHWHIDFSHVNIAGTFHYLCTVLDGCSRHIVHWEIRQAMREADAELVLQKARELFPRAGVRSDHHPGMPTCGFDPNAINPNSLKPESNLTPERQSDISAEPVYPQHPQSIVSP